MGYVYFTEEQKERANSVDLVDFLQRNQEKLLPSGREKRWERDHSVTVRGNRWYDHAVENGGGPISFVQRFYGLRYPEAVRQSRKSRSRLHPFSCLQRTGICAESMPIF